MANATRESLVEAEQTYVAALLTGNVGALKKQFHPSYQIKGVASSVAHSDFLDAVGSGRVKYHAIKQEPVDVKVVGSVGVIVGRVSGTAEVGGVTHEVQTNYTCEWVHTGGAWALVSTYTGSAGASPVREVAVDKAAYKGILDVQRMHTQALLGGKADSLGKVLHSSYSSLTHDGKNVGRDQLIKAIEGGELKYASIDYQVDSVRADGNIAMVTGRSWGSGQFKGQAFSAGAGFCCTFVNMDTGDPAPDKAAGWQMLSSQVSNVALA